MADVRAMLRASRDAREKITHPYASYSLDGQQLSCGLCEVKIKHESAWKSHLHTTQHKLRQTRAQEVAKTRDSEGQNRKRKASPSESPRSENKKKARPAVSAESPPEVEHDASNEDHTSYRVQQTSQTKDQGPEEGRGQQDSEPVNRAKDDTADLDDFERELAELDASVPAPPTIAAAATISSAPLTAADLAARAREEQSAQRGKRDTELADEKEDAARFLEDEFEEMEELEQRAKSLRARREALRTQSDMAKDELRPHDQDVGPASGSAPIDGASTDAHKAPQPADDDDDDEDDDDDYWNFGGG